MSEGGAGKSGDRIAGIPQTISLWETSLLMWVVIKKLGKKSVQHSAANLIAYIYRD